MSDTPRPSKDQLLQAMSDTSVTEEWDVVVSYSVAKLNDTLKKLWKAGDLFNNIQFPVRVPGADTVDHYTLNLHNPTLKFLPGVAAVAKLTIGISGKCETYGSDEVMVIETTELYFGSYQLDFEVPLVSMPGTVDGHPAGEKSGRKGDAIVFLSSTDEAHNIVFHFADIPKETWSLHTIDEKLYTVPEITEKMEQCSFQLHSWFCTEVNQLDYVVARITNATGDKFDASLQPKSFVFATHGQGKTAVLSLYMQTVGSGNDPGKANPSFRFKGVELPIPQDQEASIIIRHELMLEKFLLKHLNKSFAMANGESDPVTNSRQTGQEGFRFNIKVNRTWIEPANPGQIRDFPWTAFLKVDGFLLDLKDHPLILSIMGGEARWSLDYTSEAIEWQTMIMSGGADPGVGEVGAFKVNVKVDKRSRIISKEASLTSSAIEFAPADFNITTTAIPKKEEDLSWLEKIARALAPVHSHDYSLSISDSFRNLVASFTKFEMGVASLDFLATKNVFACDKDIIKINRDAGMMTPHDVLLVGNIALPPELKK